MIKSGIKIGDKFNRWTVVGEPIIINTRRKYLCKCDCGTERYVDYYSLVRGESKSCGCFMVEFNSNRPMPNHYKTHNMSHTRFYRIWRNIICRCKYKSHESYKNYGGRGITVCDRWSSFENFKEDMYESYLNHVNEFGEKNTSIDRIDVNGNYEPSNCRWATIEEQANNTKRNRLVLCNGEYLSTRQISEKYNINHSTVRSRLCKGMDVFGNRN